MYRVSNNGDTCGRPKVLRIEVFSDLSCSREINASYIGESGHDSKYGNGSAAFDKDPLTRWRAQCVPCHKNEAWITFESNEEVKCIKTLRLGAGFGGELEVTGCKPREFRDYGIKVEIQMRDGSWKLEMQSHEGNDAIRGT